MTELGEVVNNIMKQSFASIVDVNFTAYMEGLLDMIAEGKVEWKSVISNFYPDLKEADEKAEKELETVKYGYQIRSPWKVPCMSRIPGMPQHQTVSGENRSCLPEMWKRHCLAQDKERQTLLWM